MSIADWLLLAQTIILLMTGAVIYWYTRETQRLRQASTTQADLLRQQVETMRETLQMDIQEQLRASKPFIRWHGGSNGPDRWTRQFQNEGGPITHIAVHTSEALETFIGPRDLLQTNQQGEVAFVPLPGNRLPDTWRFQISYVTRLDQPGAKAFIVEGGTPRENEA